MQTSAWKMLATITAGTTSTTVTVTVNDDDIVKNNETITATISDAHFSEVTSFPTRRSSDLSGQATIENNDTATLSIDDISVAEDGTFTFTISSDKVASQDMKIGMATV